MLRLGLLFSGAALIARSIAARPPDADDAPSASGPHWPSSPSARSELARLNEQLVEDSRRDPLTGIGNRRALSEDLPMFEALQP